MVLIMADHMIVGYKKETFLLKKVCVWYESKYASTKKEKFGWFYSSSLVGFADLAGNWHERQHDVPDSMSSSISRQNKLKLDHINCIDFTIRNT